MPDPSAVAVIAPNWLGDAVMALPAVADLRHRFSRARLIVAARRSVAGLFAMVPAVDEIIELQWRGRARDLRSLSHDTSRLRGASAGLALLLPNSFASAWLVRSAGIEERWGYAGDLRTALLTRAVPKPHESLHQSAYYQQLLRSLGLPCGEAGAAVVVPGKALTEARRLLIEAEWDGVRPIVAMAPGAAYGTAKRWLPEHFASLSTTLVIDRGAQVVLVGSADDAEAARVMRETMPGSARGRVSDLCGRTTLEVLAGVLTQARACVSNDSGAMHFAAAVGVPVVALFGPTNELETAPVPRPGVQTHLLINPVSCRPCMLRECPIDHPCMRDLAPARVLAAVDSVLASPLACGERRE